MLLMPFNKFVSAPAINCPIASVIGLMSVETKAAAIFSSPAIASLPNELLPVNRSVTSWLDKLLTSPSIVTYRLCH